MSDIRPLSSVDVHVSCPTCGARSIQRSSEPQNGTMSMNGAALWVFIESCIMCGWHVSTRNVKIGA